MMSRKQATIATAFCSVLVLALVGGQIADAVEVNGGGTLEVDLGPGEFENLRVGFNAREIGNGMARGQIEVTVYDHIGFYITSHLRVDCMLVLDERTVLLGATVVYDNYPEYIGTTATFIVRDNGEGPNDPPDERSHVFYSLDFGSELNCETSAVLLATEYDVEDLLMPIDTGNIQVRP